MRKTVLKALSAGLMGFVVGCAQVEIANHGPQPELRRVAVDLVSVLGQLPGLDPHSTTTRVSRDPSDFGVAVANALRDVGYGVQRTSSDESVNRLSYKRTQTVDTARTTTEFEVGLRGVRVTRAYSQSGDQWVPASPIRVYGSEPTRVLVNDELHSQDQPARTSKARRVLSGVVFHDAQGTVIDSRRFTVLVRARANSGDASRVSAVQRSLSLGQSSVFGRQRALAATDQRQFEPVAEVMLTFRADDPATLGVRNKRAIAALLQRHQPGADRFIIQGCSQGASLAWDGTERVSLERQQRVNKELLVSGVSPAAIAEEGCKRRSAESELPERSVRLQLTREINSLTN